MINRRNLLFICLTLFLYCKKPKNLIYSEQVGDILFDEKIDDPNFTICDNEKIFQYYNFNKGIQFKGEKPKISDHFKSLSSPAIRGETGYVTIRFIVNCKGKTGRFRIQEMDDSYKAKNFNKILIKNLLKLTKNLDGWVAGKYSDTPTDYYQYLTFKIQDGKLIEIMP